MTNQQNSKIELPVLKGDFDKERWRADASCADKDSKLFFAESRGGGSVYFEARCICFRCPVQKDCLDFAVENSIYAGIWGGMPYRERLKYANGKRTHVLTLPELIKGMRGKQSISSLADKIGITVEELRNQMKKGKYKYGNR